MGLIKAITGAAGGVLADQWKEFFYCDAIDNDTLVVKGQKRTTSRTSNTKGNDNLISDGSVIAVADGQCMIIVEQGKVVEVCAEAGEFTYDSSTEPSLFSGSLGESIKETFKTIGKRFTYGGDTGKDQRVYYFNIKEIMDNKFGTPTPVPFRVVDSRIGLDIDVSLRCNGTYSFRIADPLIFYANVCGNVQREYSCDEISSQLKAEFISALAPAIGRLSALELRPNQIPAHNAELEQYLNEELSEKWASKRGLRVKTVAMNPPTLPEEDQELIKTAQKTAMYRDPSMAAANLATAQADAMRTAAGNTAGAMTGFMGMGMANQAGGMNLQSLFQMGQQQQAAAPAAPAQEGWKCSCGATATGKFCPECGAKKPEPKPEPKDGEWTCACGTKNTGKFCHECGAKRPEPKPEGWTCSCGAVNKGKFCPECGAKKPADARLYKCDKCGWEPEDPENPPKFCPECGDLFDDSDVK